mgnify:CR=1 FL=1
MAEDGHGAAALKAARVAENSVEAAQGRSGTAALRKDETVAEARGTGRLGNKYGPAEVDPAGQLTEAWAEP